MTKPAISAAEARRLLDYDASTGALTWKPRPEIKQIDRVWNLRYAGRRAGFDWMGRYVLISLFKKRYYGHRIAFLLMMGRFPDDEIDHIDGNGLNNAWDNLREATRSQNNCNKASSKRSGNITGLKGVRIDRNGRYFAQIQYLGKHEVIGGFDTAEEAHGAYCARAHKLHGEFARTTKDAPR